MASAKPITLKNRRTRPASQESLAKPTARSRRSTITVHVSYQRLPDLPTISLPHLKLPVLNLPRLRVPRWKLPRLKKQHLKKMRHHPKLRWQLGSVQLPKLRLAQLPVPTPQLPQLQLPQLHRPSLSWPDWLFPIHDHYSLMVLQKMMARRAAVRAALIKLVIGTAQGLVHFGWSTLLLLALTAWRTLTLAPVRAALQKLVAPRAKTARPKTISIKSRKGDLFSTRRTTRWSQFISGISNFATQVSLELRSILFGEQSVSPLAPKRKRRKSRRPFSYWLHRAWSAFTYPFRALVRHYAWLTVASLILTAIMLGGTYFVYDFVFKDLPDPQVLTQQKQVVTTKILDRNGKVLYRIYRDENRTPIPLSQVPQHMINATIAIEDKEFYNHHGFSLRGITRALVANSKGETVQGGSTITQQLVKNRLLTSEKTLRRKLREIILSVLVDGNFTKDQILEMYLNEVAYGGSTYGVEEAAHRYFDKSARDLTLAESALLAGLPQAPSVYSPYGSNPEFAKARQHEVLRRMVEDGYITADQAETAKQEQITFRTDHIDIKAPHFVMYIKRLLAEQYGEDMVEEGGLEVRTSLDLDLQNEVQQVVTDEVTQLERLHITNGAALVTNPKTGEVLAMVGSKNYFDFAHDGQVNVTLRPRQPGSSIKPLTYAVAFERGKNPSSTEEDSAITFVLPGTKPYTPKNYDGKFHGRVTLRESLGSSYNIPAVKLLAWVGLDTVIDKGEEMGISTWNDRSRFGLSLTLGGGEVLMIDMAQVYGTFANNGYTTNINPILEVKDYTGKTLYRNNCAHNGTDCPKKKTLDSRVAYQITDVLKDNNARTPAFGARSVLVLPGQEVAVKTGTTNNLKDNWTIGYTSDRVVAVWVGNNDGSPMSYVASGVTGASPIWADIMQLLLDKDQPHKFPPPEGLIKVQVCARTGTLPCRGCPYVKEEYFVPGTEPKQACSPAQFAPKPKPSPDPNRDKILEGMTTDTDSN